MKMHIKIFCLSIGAILFFAQQSNAQIQVKKVSEPNEIDKCGEDKTFTFSIANTTNSEIADGDILLNLPVGAYYSPGTIAGGAVEDNITNLNQPTFKLTVGATAAATISFDAHVTCDFNITGTFNYEFNSTGLDAPFTINQLNTPNLLITNVTNKNIEANVGDIITRDITIIQNSQPSDELNKFSFSDDHTSGIEVQNIEILVGGAVVAGGTFDAVTSTLILDGAAIQTATGGADIYFNHGETITLRETVKFVDCSNANSNLKAYWGCDILGSASQCQAATESAIINQPTGIHQLQTSVSVQQKLDFCTNAIYEITVTNTGSAPAYNVILPVGVANDGTATKPETNSGWFPDLYKFVGAEINGNTVAMVPDSPVNNAWNLMTSSLSVDPDGAGVGLEDVNGDNEFAELLAGDSFTVRIEVDYDEDWYIANASCSAGFLGPFPGHGNLHFTVGHRSETLCGNVTYVSESNSSHLMYLRETTASSTMDKLNLADGESTYLNVNYNSAYSVGNFGFFENGGILQVEYVIPAGLVYDNAQPVLHDAVNVTANTTVVGNTVTIASNNNSFKGQWKLPIKASCSTVSGATIDPVQVKVKMIPGNCNKVIEFACFETTPSVNFLCDPCLTAIDRDGFEVVRTSFGFADNTMTTRATAATPDINLKAARPYENVSFTLDGKITGLIEQGFAEFSYRHSGTSGATDKSVPYFINPTATVHNLTTGITETNVVVNEFFDGSTDTHTMNVDLDALATTLGGYSVNDQIQVVVSCTTNKAIPLLYQQVSNLQGSWKSTIGGQEYSCEEFDSFYLEKSDAYNLIALRQVKYACDLLDLNLGPHLDTSPADNINNFPNEWHSIKYIESTIAFKGRWTMQPNSARYIVEGTATYSLPDDVITTTYDGTYTYFIATNPDDGSFLGNKGTKKWAKNYVNIKVAADCDIDDGFIDALYSNKYIDNYYAVDPAHRILESYANSPFSTMNGSFYTNSSKNFSTLTSTYLATGKTAEWDVRIENTTNFAGSNKDIENSWIQLESPSGGIEVTSVQEIDASGNLIGSPIGVTQIGSSNKWFAELGTIGGFSNRDFRIFSNFISCGTDDLVVTMGNNCLRYPSILGDELLYESESGNFMCDTQEVTLQLDTQKIQLETILTQPTGEQNFCENLAFDFNVTNLDLSRAYNNKITLRAPEGLVYATGTSTLTFNSNEIALADPTDTNGVLTWVLDSTTLPELGGASDTLSNTYTIGFETKTKCGLISGSVFNIEASGERGCGELDSSSVYSKPILLADAPKFNNVYVITTNSDDTITCGANKTVAVTFNHISGSASILGEKIEVVIPNNFSYEDNFVNINNATGVTLTGNTPNSPIESSRSLLFELPVGTTAGQLIEFSFDISLSDALSYSCNETAPIYARTTIQGPALSCEGVNCTVSAVTAISETEDITIEKPTITTSMTSATSVYNASTTNEDTTLEFTLSNTSAYDLPIGATVSLFQDTNVDGVFDTDDLVIGTHTTTAAIVAGSTLSQTAEFNVPSNTNCNIYIAVTPFKDCVCSSLPAAVTPTSLEGIAGQDKSVCEKDETITLGTNSNTDYTYLWEGTSGTEISYLNDAKAAQPEFTYTDVALATDTTFTYSLTVTKPGGCEVTDTVSVTVIAAPTNLVIADNTGMEVYAGNYLSVMFNALPSNEIITIYKDQQGTNTVSPATATTSWTATELFNTSGSLWGRVENTVTGCHSDFVEIPYTILERADVSVTKTDNSPFYSPGENTVYTITIINNGFSTASNIVVSDPLPVGITSASWISDNGTSGTGALNDILTTLTNGEEVTYTVTLSIPENYMGDLTNTVTVSSSTTDDNLSNNTAVDTNTIIVDCKTIRSGAVDICAILTVDPNNSAGLLDCDGDGIDNATECANNTDLTNPCDPIKNPGDITPVTSGTYYIEWAVADCDGDGVSNGQEVTDGTDSFNSCEFLSTSQASSALAPAAAWSDTDCDGDGISNGQEVNDGTDPTNPCDSIGGTPPADIVCDSDGDGVLDDQEILDHTDPNDPCDFEIESITETQTGLYLEADCDGDGVTNGEELDDGTNPEDSCDYVVDSVTISPSGDYLITDCDGDGVSNGVEINDQTDPLDPCDFEETSIALERTGLWLMADCDGDEVSNGQELESGTNPYEPCSAIGGITPSGVVCDIVVLYNLVEPWINDGIFQIYNIESYPDNTVNVYNRWGVLVFETKGYDNDSNAFRGISKGRLTVRQNEELPVGTYFYIIDYMNDGVAKTKNGYIYLNR